MQNKLFFIKNHLLIVLILITLFFNLQLAKAEVLDNKAPRTINVIGHAKISLIPDIAHINFSVRTENNDVAQAVSANNNLSEQVISTLRKFQIASKDIRTNNFNIYPQQHYDNNGKPRDVITYNVDNTVTVTLRDIRKLGEIISAAVNSGSNSISGLQFDAANRDSILTAAKKTAVTNAIEQAKELASAANVVLGNILSINSFENSPIFPMRMYAEKGFADAAISSPAPILPGQLEIIANVNVVFEIQ